MMIADYPCYRKMNNKPAWIVDEDGYVEIVSPFPIPTPFRKRIVDGNNRLSPRFFWRDADGGCRKPLADALTALKGFRIKDPTLLFTPFLVNIGKLFRPDHERIHSWLADNTRDVWYPTFERSQTDVSQVIGFHDQQDADNFAIYWALRIRDV